MLKFIQFIKRLLKLKSKKMATEKFIIAIPVYNGVDLMDIAAPREMFTWVDNWEVYYIGKLDPRTQRPAPIVTREGTKLIPDVGYKDEAVQSPNLIWVPGGAPKSLTAIMANPKSPFTAYVTEKGKTAEWVTSVCEGAILLANTGLLNGYKATTHWAFYPCMSVFPEITMVEGYPRYVKDRNRITGGGIASALDESLYIIELIMGTEVAINVQQQMQYYPDPPVSSSITPSTCCPVDGMLEDDKTCPHSNDPIEKNFIIAIPVYDGVDLMDFAAPKEVFSWVKEWGVYYIGELDADSGSPKTIETRDGTKLIPDFGYNDEAVQSPNLIWVPGGAPDDLTKMMADPKCPLTAYVTEKGKKADWVTSVCEGAILLANTGLLDGYNATTHWAFYPCMAAFPNVKMVADYPRYVKDGNRITGGGISSGMDEALYIIELTMGTEMAITAQQKMQYYPKPPVSSSIPTTDCCPVKGMVKNTCHKNKQDKFAMRRES